MFSKAIGAMRASAMCRSATPFAARGYAALSTRCRPLHEENDATNQCKRLRWAWKLDTRLPASFQREGRWGEVRLRQDRNPRTELEFNRLRQNLAVLREAGNSQVPARAALFVPLGGLLRTWRLFAIIELAAAARLCSGCNLDAQVAIRLQAEHEALRGGQPGEDCYRKAEPYGRALEDRRCHVVRV